MRRSRSEGFLFPGRNPNPSPRKWLVPHLFLLAVAALYLLHVAAKYASFGVAGGGDSGVGGVSHGVDPLSSSSRQLHSNPKPDKDPYGRISAEVLLRRRRREQRRRGWTGNLTELERMAADARSLGLKAWEEVKKYEKTSKTDYLTKGTAESCPSQAYLTDKVTALGPENQTVMVLPCGMELGSAVTVVGVPEEAHPEPVEGRQRIEEDIKMVSNFVVELQGLKAVEGEEPPRILHLNPRIKGDWSGRPVIEHNTCYRMHWGKAMRCDGLASENEDTVDGFSKCEKWKHSVELKESKTTSWLNRFIGRAKKPEITWPFPFVEGKLFVLTIRAGMEGYHTHVGGRHVTSFPYQLGFSLEDATGLAIKGNVDIHSVYATSLPKSHPSSSFKQVLEMTEKWKSLPLPQGPIHLFVGILSATNHFAERMAVRKSWMQYPSFKSSQVVARFFVALGPRKEVNAMLKKEADYFGDIVIVPFIDHYDLVVLKTIAICEHGVHNTTAAYIMKCDDDTFVRVDVVLKQIDEIGSNHKSLYMGNLNRFHRPLRNGKWAVTYEEWPEDIYPPYANGPAYIISDDIARSIVSKHANQRLRLFKMEDVSMGMWVEDFNVSTTVQYSHNWKFCQYGCMKNYLSAHYQSPKQMICLWDKLEKGQAECCNYR